MATGTQGEFVAVVNDTDPKSNGKAYSLKISGNNYSQILGKKIGDVVDGIFVGEGDKTLSGYKLQITGGADKTGTPLEEILKAVQDNQSSNPIYWFQGPQSSFQNQRWEKEAFPIQTDGLRKRRNFRGNTITQDTRQINLKVVEAGKKALGDILAAKVRKHRSESREGFRK